MGVGCFVSSPSRGFPELNAKTRVGSPDFFDPLLLFRLKLAFDALRRRGRNLKPLLGNGIPAILADSIYAFIDPLERVDQLSDGPSFPVLQRIFVETLCLERGQIVNVWKKS